MKTIQLARTAPLANYLESLVPVQSQISFSPVTPVTSMISLRYFRTQINLMEDALKHQMWGGEGYILAT